MKIHSVKKIKKNINKLEVGSWNITLKDFKNKFSYCGVDEGRIFLLWSKWGDKYFKECIMKQFLHIIVLA